jgi:hypothetical protein
MPAHQLDLALLHLLFPSASPVRSNVTCKEEEKTQTKSRFFPFFKYVFISAFSLCLCLSSFGFPCSVLGSCRRLGSCWRLCFCRVWPVELEEERVLADRRFRLEMVLDL